MRNSAVAVIVVSAAALGGTGVAHGYPIPPAPPCTFALTGPVTEGPTVTATVESVGCAALATPYFSVACLQGAQGVTQCIQGRGTDPARVSMAFEPGVAYVATGRGCSGWVNLNPTPDCQFLGPNS